MPRVRRFGMLIASGAAPVSFYVGRNNLLRMAMGKHKNQRDMPTTWRLIAAAAGLVLLVIGGAVLFFLAARSFSWGLMWLGIGAVGLGVDLFLGGLWGKWPVTLECCIYMAQ